MKSSIKLCKMYQAACPHCLPPVDGSWGLTARGVCRRQAADDCISRADPDGEQVVDLGDYLVVAGFRSKDLFKAGPGVLYDVLPVILPDEWEILVSFCRDYTARGIPWMVAQEGRAFKLVKKNSGGTPLPQEKKRR
jgi:hypothetical protein